MSQPSQQVQDLFEELCELPRAEREARLRACCDETARVQVRRLLELFDRPDSSFDRQVRLAFLPDEGA